MTPPRTPYPPAEGPRGGRPLGLWQRLRQWWRRTFAGGGSEFLCDTCKYDYGTACTRPERPNAKKCPDFRRR